MVLIGLVSLLLVPVATYGVARRRWPCRVGLLTGASLGLIISPASLGLYGSGLLFAYVDLGTIPTMVGLALAIFHGIPGMQLMTAVGFRTEGTDVAGPRHVVMALMNGLIWGSAYGTVGWLLDRYIVRRPRPRNEDAARSRAR